MNVRFSPATRHWMHLLIKYVKLPDPWARWKWGTRLFKKWSNARIKLKKRVDRAWQNVTESEREQVREWLRQFKDAK